MKTVLKLVIAIVRPERANDGLEALYRAEFRGLSAPFGAPLGTHLI